MLLFECNLALRLVNSLERRLSSHDLKAIFTSILMKGFDCVLGGGRKTSMFDVAHEIRPEVLIRRVASIVIIASVRNRGKK